MMSITKFCQKYRCDQSAIYRKIKRRQTELEGHITESGVLQLDEFAENLLKPKNTKTSEIQKLQSVEYELFLEKEKCKNLEFRKNEVEHKLEELQDSYDSLFSDFSEMKIEREKQQAEIDFLFSENQSLKSELSEIKDKPRGLFGRKG